MSAVRIYPAYWHWLGIIFQFACFLSTSGGNFLDIWRLDSPTLHCPRDNVFDFIVVGAGSAGAVVANRLTEDPNVKVLLLEMGDKPPAYSEIPMYGISVLRTELDWSYLTVPQKNCCKVWTDSRLPLEGGKVLGGSSSINGMTYTKCSPRDYDNWNELVGMGNWSYSGVLPYFLKMEDYQIPQKDEDRPFHGEGGPMTVTVSSFKTPISDSFLEGGLELGYPINDINGAHPYGFTRTPASIKNGSRWSTYRAYIQPASRRKNLFIYVNSRVLKILINNATKTATGVVYERGWNRCHANVRREVIVSAGAIQTPKLLMLSGVGPAETLNKFKIPVIQDLAGVGQHLKDHPQFPQVIATLEEPVGMKNSRYDTPEYQKLYKETHTGPLSTPLKLAGIGFVNTSRGTKEWPNMEFFMNPDVVARINWRNVISSMMMFNPVIALEQARLALEYIYKDVVEINILLLRPRSTGFVTLASDNPEDDPLIDPRIHSVQEDLDDLTEGVKIVMALLKTKPFLKYGAKRLPFPNVMECANEEVDSDRHYQCLMKIFTSSTNHPSCTCKMAGDGDPMGVLNGHLQVRGVKNLRVVDASAFPEIPSGHTNAPTIMLAEKACDIIKEYWKNNK